MEAQANDKEKGIWIRKKGYDPQCSLCGYYWHETVIGEVGKGKSNIFGAKYCPNCGKPMIVGEKK